MSCFLHGEHLCQHSITALYYIMNWNITGLSVRQEGAKLCVRSSAGFILVVVDMWPAYSAHSQ